MKSTFNTLNSKYEPLNLWYQILQVQNNNCGEINTFDILCRVGIKYISLQQKHLEVSLAKLC